MSHRSGEMRWLGASLGVVLPDPGKSFVLVSMVRKEVEVIVRR